MILEDFIQAIIGLSCCVAFMAGLAVSICCITDDDSCKPSEEDE